MSRSLLLSLCLALPALFPMPSRAATPAAPTDDPQVAAAYAADQRERADLAQQTSKDALRSFAERLAAADMARRRVVMDALRDGRLRTAADYRHAATVMQHGQAADDYALAHALATMGSALAPDDRDLRWLAAAATDRWLLAHRQPQWYGTQPVCDARADPPVCRLDVAEGAVDDTARATAGIAPLAELKAQADARARQLGEQLRGAKAAAR
ncbi:MAG: hypothetical protein NVV68_16725 [Dokdonella sp.]|nr:hypothetical protein [Dokdonella sp.]